MKQKKKQFFRRISSAVKAHNFTEKRAIEKEKNSISCTEKKSPLLLVQLLTLQCSRSLIFFSKQVCVKPCISQ